MSRYIDAQAVKLKFQRYLMPNVDIDGTVSVEDAERYFIKTIEDIPTADVVEVRHGEWDYIATHDCFSCNLCKFDSDVTMKYCGGCGAKMDGERSSNGKGSDN